MHTEPRILLYLLDHAYQTLKDNLRGLTLAEALFVPQGGYRSVLGTLKHATAGIQPGSTSLSEKKPCAITLPSASMCSTSRNG